MPNSGGVTLIVNATANAKTNSPIQRLLFIRPTNGLKSPAIQENKLITMRIPSNHQTQLVKNFQTTHSDKIESSISSSSMCSPLKLVNSFHTSAYLKVI